MPETHRARLTSALDELCGAVGADAGGALYIDDGEGVLHLAASAGHAPGRPPTLVDRLRGHVNPTDKDGRTLILNVPGPRTAFVVLARRGGSDFTQRDRTLAGIYLRQLTETGAEALGHFRAGGWTRQLEAIQRIAARLTRLASVEEVGATICTETRQVIEYSEAQVLVATGSDGGMRVVAAAGGHSIDGSVVPLPNTGPGGDALARAAVNGIPVMVSDLPDLGPSRPGPCSLLAVPLHFESRVIGVICLTAGSDHQFDDDDLRLLQILSDQAAVAIENARLLSGRDQLVHELAALLEVSEAAGAASDEVGLASLLAERIRRATRMDAAIVSRWDDGSTVLRVLWRDEISGPESPTDVTESPLRRNVLRDGRPIVIQADSTESGPDIGQLRSIGGRTLIALPLNAGGRTIGIVELISFQSARHFDEAEMQAAEAMASLAATGLEKVRLVEQLRSAADMDLVTGVHNHRYLQERLRQEVARSARSHSPFAVLMLDLDKFKPVNDRHGHADGDRVLHTIGATIKDYVRTSDIVARYGGDEFVVLMPDASPEQAAQVAQRVVAGIRARRHEMSDGSEVGVGVSGGLAVYPTDGRTSAQLLQAADAAMYSAKRTGTRQVERSSPNLLSLDVASVRAAS
jgi:diguanylate cyclase (GGDEF)-like protein